MPYDVDKILVGISEILIDGTPIGGTRDGLTWAPEKNVHVIEYVDQAPGEILDLRALSTNHLLRFNILEATLENLRIALDLESVIETGPNSRTLKFGGDRQATAHEVVFYGEAPNGKQRKVLAYKGKFVDPGEIPFKANDPTMIPVAVRLLPDLNRTRGTRIGYTEDVTT